MKIAFIPADGPVKLHDLDPEDTLSQLQRLVGGFIEAVQVDGEATLWLNEDGKAESLPVNVRSHALVAHLLQANDFIVGDCVLTGYDLEEGETVGLGQRWLTFIEEYFQVE